jgi:hypothetical protein
MFVCIVSWDVKLPPFIELFRLPDFGEKLKRLAVYNGGT